jgi:hypothetical protein
MTTEAVLIWAISGFIILGTFLGEMGPLATFRKSGPRLGATIERDISVGTEFQKASEPGRRAPNWLGN